MDPIYGFINHGMLADGNFLEMLGPLLLFGIYAIGALAKKWANSRSDTEEKPPTELQKAVQRRYQQIYEKQAGKAPPAQTQQNRQVEPVKTARAVQPTRPVEAAKFVRQPQPKQKTYDVPQIRNERRPQSVQPQKQLQQSRYQKPIRPKTQQPKPAPKLQTAKRVETKTIKKPAKVRSLASMMRQPKNLQTAIILKEILDKPLALRDF